MYDWNALLEKCFNVKLNCNEKAKLFYMDIDIHENRYINADDIYEDIAEDVETRFDTSNYKLNRPLQKGKNKKVIGVMKDELIMGKNLLV